MSLLHYDFDGEYAMKLSLWGGGTVNEDDLNMTVADAYGEYREQFRDDPTSVSVFIEDCFAYKLDYGFTAIDPAFLEQIPTLKELILPDSITSLDVTPALEKIFKKNNTLIRGSIDAFAEEFADANGLRFRPSDFRFAERFFEAAQESTWLTLIFKRDGSAVVKESISSPGSSAGNCFGGDWYYDLKRDFYNSQTVEEIAELVRSYMYNSVIEDGRLASFLEKVKTHRIFWGKNE